MEINQMAAKPTIATATISAGTSISSNVNLSAGAVVMIIMPAQWNPANIGFLVSVDNTNFYDLVDARGAEILLPVVPSAAIMIDPSFTQAALQIQIRSGQGRLPVIQDADCVFTLAIQ
jgi:hypothetical protein